MKRKYRSKSRGNREDTEIKKLPRMKVMGKLKVVECRLRWAGLIRRMSEEGLTKRAWKGEDGGRRII